MLRIKTPDHAGSREQAQSLTRQLPPDLAGERVTLDCSEMVIGTPSFLDEIVKQVLTERGAAGLEVAEAPERARELIERSANNRGAGGRLKIIQAV